MNPRKWDANITNRTPIGELRNEHDATVQAWQDSQAELERIGKINDSMCDTIAELEARVKELESPIRLPFSDAQIEVMARAYHEAAPAAMAAWPSLSPTTQKILMSAIRAALAAGGLEPCAVPEYKPEDVALIPERASDEELEKLFEETRRNAPVSSAVIPNYHAIRAVRTRVEAPLLSEIQRLTLDRDLWRKNSDLRESERDALRAELEAVKAERDTLQNQARRYKKDYHAALGEAQELRAELAALRQRSVPVKVRCGVTESEVSRAVYGVKEDYITPGVKAVMDMCLAHAVIDVPPGVPSVEELATIGHEANTNFVVHEAAAAAIRDRVLAGVAGEITTGAAIQKMHDATSDMTRGEALNIVLATPTEEQVESLAWAIYRGAGGHQVNWADESIKDLHMSAARAAIAHGLPLRANVTEAEIADALCNIERQTAPSQWEPEAAAVMALLRERQVVVPSVDPDAWKTPLEAYCCDNSNDKLEIFGGEINSIGVAMWRQHSHLLTICLSPADAARVSLHLASYAAAHGCPVAAPVWTQEMVDDCRAQAWDMHEKVFGAPAWSGPTRAEAEAKIEEVARKGVGSRYPDFHDWLLPQLPTERAEMPSVHDLALAGVKARKRFGSPSESDLLCAEAILTALRPWLQQPTGWAEMPSVGEIEDIIENHIGWLREDPDDSGHEAIKVVGFADAAEAILTADTLTSAKSLSDLVNIATDAYTRAPATDWSTRMQYVVVAILRAAKAEVDIKYHDLIEALNNHNTEVSNEEWDRTFQDLLNSRIRYRVEVPETAAAGWELDVTAEELRGHCITSNAEEFLAYLKSRIRTAECKECKTWQDMYTEKLAEYRAVEAAVGKTYEAIKPVITDAARAALEGE